MTFEQLTDLRRLSNEGFPAVGQLLDALQATLTERDALQARLDALTPGVVRIPAPDANAVACLAAYDEELFRSGVAWARTHAEVVVVEAVGPVMEALAEMEHQRWSEQAQKALFDLTGERRERWTRQAATPYQDLSEEEKEQDREQVRRIFSRLRAMQTRPAGEGVER